METADGKGGERHREERKTMRVRERGITERMEAFLVEREAE